MAILWQQGACWLRRFSTDAKTDTLSRWLKEWVTVPEVVIMQGADPPTALSWLRRRGPPLPQATLHKLFRSSTVRLYNPTTQRVGRASRAQPLPPGALLLVPKAALAPVDGGRARSSTVLAAAASSHQQALSPAQERRQRSTADWAERLCASLLVQDTAFLALNKPAGLACQGGSGVAHSVDSLKAAAFVGLPGLSSSKLRLVHRLDQGTTGVLLLATSAESAAWLAAAFRGGSSSSSSSSGGGSGAGSGSGRQAGRATTWPADAGSAGTGASIRKLYWAVVALPQEGGASARLPAVGTIRLPVPSSKDRGAAVHAQTWYKVLHRGEGLAWLALEPVTGRKHQLRLHCARGLGAAILGDGRYGKLRSEVQAAALGPLRQHLGPAGGGGAPPLFLHCRRLVVHTPSGRRRQVEVTAPLPAAWQVLLARQGWPLPPDT